MSPRSPDLSFLPAGADEAEADPSEGVAVVSFLVDTERHPPYRDGVRHSDAPLAPSGWAEPADHGDTRHKTEHLRQSRLSRWQEQR